MSVIQRRVLFLGHDASRTGAPLLMLELIKWLATHSNLKGSALLKRGGEMESEYRAVISTRCYGAEYQKMNCRLHRRVLRKLRLSTIRGPNVARIYPAEEYPVGYANTVDT